MPDVGVILEYLSADVFSAEFKLFILYGKTFDVDSQGDELGSRLTTSLMNCRTVYIEHVQPLRNLL